MSFVPPGLGCSKLALGLNGKSQSRGPRQSDRWRGPAQGYQLNIVSDAQLYNEPRMIPPSAWCARVLLLTPDSASYRTGAGPGIQRQQLRRPDDVEYNVCTTTFLVSPRWLQRQPAAITPRQPPSSAGNLKGLASSLCRARRILAHGQSGDLIGSVPSASAALHASAGSGNVSFGISLTCSRCWSRGQSVSPDT